MEHAYWKTDHLPNYNAFSMIPKVTTHHTTETFPARCPSSSDSHPHRWLF